MMELKLKCVLQSKGKTRNKMFKLCNYDRMFQIKKRVSPRKKVEVSPKKANTQTEINQHESHLKL